MSLKILAEENRGVLLDIVVFFLNLLLMQWLTGYVIYLCLNLVLVSVILGGLGGFLFGERLLQNGDVFVPLIIAGMICTIVQTILIYRYFSPPKQPPRLQFLQHPESETLGDICIFVNMILFQIVWNLLSFAGLGRPYKSICVICG